MYDGEQRRDEKTALNQLNQESEPEAERRGGGVRGSVLEENCKEGDGGVWGRELEENWEEDDVEEPKVNPDNMN